MSYYGFGPYVSVAEKRAKAEKKLKQLKKKNPDIEPVIIEGRSLATTWWGKEWNKNLERYADYSNRIGRGRSYVRHRAVLDLKIKAGEVSALVQGSSSQPYRITISIKPIPRETWTSIITSARGKLDSLQQLLAGKFPKDLALLFTQSGDGLFPSPQDISFDCSCPDWASMCKHVAAALYGIGARLDEQPNLFFTLRNVDMNDLISETVKQSQKDLLAKANQKTGKVMETNSGLSDLFGIDLDDSPVSPPANQPAPPKGKKKATRKVAKPEIKPAKRADKTKKPPQKKIAKPRKKATTPAEIMAMVESMIKKKKTGVKVADIIETTGLDPIKVRNSVARLKQLGRIESAGWGVYRAD